MFLLFTFFFFASSCGEEKQPEQQENSIYGTWQLTERFEGGSLIPRQSVENGEIIIFSKNNSYSGSSFQCDGTYNINNEIIEIMIPCTTMDTIKYAYFLENSDLKLMPYPSTCDEGCYDKYKKISSEK